MTRSPLSLLVALALLFLTACGSGGGKGGNSAPTPPEPPAPPVDIVTLYDCTPYTAGGIFTGQGNGWCEFHTVGNRMVVDTDALTPLTCYLTHSDTGWRGTVTHNGATYSVWFWPEKSTLLVGDVNATSNAVGFTIAVATMNG